MSDSKGSPVAYGLPRNPGKHAGHSIHPHKHDTRSEDGKLKPCSGRWFCETCRDPVKGYPGEWFTAQRCYEGQPK
jgi:hypothetical protein